MPSKRPTLLAGLRLTETSVVDKGANRHASILLCKRDDGEDDGTAAYRAAFDKAAAAYRDVLAKGAGADAFDAAMAGQEAQETIQAAWTAFYETMDALRGAVCAIVENADIPPADKAAAIKEAMQRAVEQIPDAIAEEAAEKRQRDPAAGGGVGKGAGSPPALSTSRTAAGDGQTEDQSVPDSTLEAQLADLKARLEKAEADKTAAEAKVSEVSKAENERVSKIEADLAKAAERAEEAEKVAKAEREMRLEAEFTKRAEAELPHLAGEPVMKGRMLRAIVERTTSTDEAVKKQAEAELATLKAADKAASALFGEVGKSGRPASGDGSAYAEVDSRATKLMEADPKLSKGDAQTRVMRSDRALAKRYREEQVQ
jgi:hypothetical protein